jgi:type IV secretion system protein VirB4
MVWDERLGTALEKAAYIAGLINAAGFTAKVETVNAFNAWLSMQPGNVYANVRRPLLSSGNLSHVIPLSSVWAGMETNDWTRECFGCSAPLLVCSTQSRVAFFLNLNVGDVGHAFVFGPSGAGKSTLLCLLETQFLKYKGANVIVLDKDKTARGATIAVGGVYAEPGGADAAFQPLRDLDAESDLSWAAEFVKLLLECQHTPVTAAMSEAIVAALKQIRDEKAPAKRTLSTFQQYVNYTNPATGQNDVRAGVQPYTINGEYGLIFDAEDTSLALAKWVMIEMGPLMRLGAAAVTPALMFIFHFIERIWTKPDGTATGEPTLLILDEAWVFLDNDFFARKIEEWLVTLRKKKVFCVFATQEVAKAAQSRLRTTIVSQCQTKIYLADPSALTAVVASSYRDFGLEDNEIAAIARARMKRDYLYKSVKGTRVFELCLDDYQLALLAPDHDLLDALEAEHGRNSGIPLAKEILKRKGFKETYGI